MTATDLLHHVFSWEVTTGVERWDLDDDSSDEDA